MKSSVAIVVECHRQGALKHNPVCAGAIARQFDPYPESSGSKHDARNHSLTGRLTNLWGFRPVIDAGDQDLPGRSTAQSLGGAALPLASEKPASAVPCGLFASASSALDRQRNTHPTADAQGRQPLFSIPPLHLMQQGHQNPAA